MTKSEMYDRMRAIVDGAKRENRGLTDREASEFDRLMSQYDRHGDAETRGFGGGANGVADAEHREAFNNYLRYGEITSELRTNPLSTLPGAPAAGSATAGYGGYLVPQGFWDQMAVALKAYGGIASSFRQVNTPTGNPMPWPTINPTANVGTLLSENTQVSEVDFTFGQGMLSAWTITSGVNLVSLQVTQDQAFPLDEFIADRTGEAIGRKLAALAVSGTGSSQPLGLITAISALGEYGGAGTSGGYVALTAGTDVKTFAGTVTELASNTLSPSSLVNLISAVDPAYYPTSAFYMSPAQAWNLRTVVDTNGRPILNFANGLTADDVTNMQYQRGSAVAQLFGFDVILDASIPALTASTVGGPVFGSLQHAMVQRNVLPGVHIMRLVERYADYLQVGYVGYMRVDMRSNDLRAVSTVQAQST